MSDLIEKKEVLNAIRACAMSEEISPKIIYQTVNQMTPAPEIIPCKDCKYRDSISGFCHNPRWGDGYAYYAPPTVPEDGFCMDGEESNENND